MTDPADPPDMIVGAERGRVVVEFGERIDRLELEPGEARELAEALAKHASAIDGKAFIVDVGG